MEPALIKLSPFSHSRDAMIVMIARVAMALRLRSEVLRGQTGTAAMHEIAGAVQNGAVAHLRRQFRTLGVFAVVLSCCSAAHRR